MSRISRTGLGDEEIHGLHGYHGFGIGAGGRGRVSRVPVCGVKHRRLAACPRCYDAAMPDANTTAVLLISCRDQKGLVAAVSEFLYRNDGNITHADQHTDREEDVFLQRVEFELASFAIARDEIAAAFRPIAERFDMRWSLRFSDEVPRIALELLYRSVGNRFPLHQLHTSAWSIARNRDGAGSNMASKEFP